MNCLLGIGNTTTREKYTMRRCMCRFYRQNNVFTSRLRAEDVRSSESNRWACNATRGLRRQSVRRTMYTQVRIAWNFLNPWANDQDQLLSHGGSTPPTQHLELQRNRRGHRNVDDLRTPGIRCGGRRSVVIFAEARADHDGCFVSGSFCR